MSGVESVGDIVTGGLIARAVEPGAGGESPTRDGACLNCGTTLTGPYCPACGQKARVHRSLATFFHDMIQGLFNFEGKIWRTLPMLAWRPGEMTRRYVEGQRARFVSPVALYLFTVFLMFAVLNITGSLGTPESFRAELKSEVAADQTAVAKLETDRKMAVAAGQDVAEIDRRIARRKEDIIENQRVLTGTVLTANEIDEDTPELLRPLVERASQNPDLLVADIQDAASKFSWLLIPLSVPFLWLLFPFNRRYHLYDHTVFVTYSLSFMMMLVIAAGVLVSLGAPSIASVLFFVPPIHMYRQLRGAYRLGRINALLRTLLLLIFSMVTSTLFLLATIAIGIF